VLLVGLTAFACQAEERQPPRPPPVRQAVVAPTTCAWRAQSSGTSKGLSAVSFVDANHGWAVGDDATILATSDGGEHWTHQIAPVAGFLRGLTFVNIHHGWAVGGAADFNGPRTVLETVDGGLTWNVRLASGSGVLMAVAAIGTDRAWTAGDIEPPGSETILRTANGGATWTAQPVDMFSGVDDIFFVDALHGWLVGHEADLLATSDGGLTWTSLGQILPDHHFFDALYFADTTRGWAAGDGIMATSDGGASWVEQLPQPSSGFLQGVSFVGSRGWAVGGTAGGGLLAHTTDGGAHWDTQTRTDAHTFRDVSFTDATHGWAVGDSGVIFACLPVAPTALTYDGDTAGDFHDPAALSATLTDLTQSSPAGVPGKSISFTLGSQTCTAVTDAAGKAACSIVLAQAPGSHSVTASFAGDPDFAASSDSRPFTITREETALTYTGDLLLAAAGSATLSATLREDGAVPIAGRPISFTVGAQGCVGITDAAGTASCVVSPVTTALGPSPITATFAGDAFYLPASATANALVFAYTPGTFVIGDQNAAVGEAVTFWDAQWSARNAPGGSSPPPSFKGYAPTTSTTPPVCGGGWSSSPGNSAHPPATVPAYLAVAAASAVDKSGATVSGNIVRLVIVKADPGYADNPGHAGTGTVVASLCAQ
jgi:photosystem II stability/assembly factor-like uncharacterized protein